MLERTFSKYNEKYHCHFVTSFKERKRKVKQN